MEEYVLLHKVQRKGRQRSITLVFVNEGEEIVVLRSRPGRPTVEYSVSQVKDLLNHGWSPEDSRILQFLRG